MLESTAGLRAEVLRGQRASYGEEIVSTVSRQLTADYGRSFSSKSLRHMMRFSEAFPDEATVSTLSRQLAWSHFRELIYLKDPYVLDFLGLDDRYLERGLEDAILRELEHFLLELGAGFSFVARQRRIQIDSDDFYIDLLFYSRRACGWRRVRPMRTPIHTFWLKHDSLDNLDDLPPPGVQQQDIIDHLEAALMAFCDVPAALPASTSKTTLG